jgi:DNA-binding response OmpR family regulator
VSGKKVLIIDDDTAIVESLRILLSIKGYEIATVQDGEEGISKAREFRPGVILLDLILPKRDGIDIYRELKKDPATDGAHIIFLSAFAEMPDIPSGEGLEDEITPDMFMPKPIDPGKLLERLSRLLP